MSRYQPTTETRFFATDNGIVVMDLYEGTIFQANPAASAIWLGILDNLSSAHIADLMKVTWSIPLETASRDVQNFIDDLLRKKLLEPV